MENQGQSGQVQFRITIITCIKNQGRETKFAFPLYTVETETKFRLRFHCIHKNKNL
jgi:hypothetical protein